MLGTDGLLYGLPSAGNMRRYNEKGNVVPFAGIKLGAWLMRHDEKGRPYIAGELPKGSSTYVGGGHIKGEHVQWPVTGQGLPICPSGTSGCERDFDIDLQGNIYVKNRGRNYHGEMKVDVYDKDGNYLRTAVWEIGDDAYGPRLDAAGNMYFATGVARKGGNAPARFKDRKYYSSLYGSIVKFGPKGGRLHFMTAEQYKNMFGFEPPELGLNKEKVLVNTGSRGGHAENKTLEGALWWRPGYSAFTPKGRHGHQCHCLGHLFDVDGFGRVFHPDMLQHQVVVLDAAGNEIARIGGYGNNDNRGPFSWVRDPKAGTLRPRGEADPPSLRSPFDGAAEIAFAFLNSVVVGEKHIYTTDTLNQRITRIRMDYAADRTCPIQ
jgi:hypothetical protein